MLVECPYCEHDFMPDDYGDYVHPHDFDEVECPKCGRTFLLRGEGDIVWDTKKIEEQDGGA